LKKSHLKKYGKKRKVDSAFIRATSRKSKPNKGLTKRTMAEKLIVRGGNSISE